MVDNALQSVLVRLQTQLDSLPLVIGGASDEKLKTRSASGKWSAHENLAHLLQHSRVTVGRIQRILAEDRPHLSSYKAESDPEWPAVSALSKDNILSQLRAVRAELNDLAAHLSPEQAQRTGLHPAYGEMSVVEWLNFFLIHEAHHLYIAMTRAH
jgi:hypothetical protein